MEYLTREYYRAGRKAVREWPEHDPAPEVTNRDDVLPFAYPPAVDTLEGAARKAGWEVRTGYSRGSVRSTRIGTYRLLDCIGVHGRHPVSGWRFVAIYARTAPAGKWAWFKISIWKAGVQTRFVDANVTDLKAFIEVAGAVGKPWFKAVAARVADQEERNRVNARNRTAKPKEGSS